MTTEPVLAFVAFAALTGCRSQANGVCECPNAGITVNVPEEDALAVERVTPSGAACSGVSASCDHPGDAGGCVRFGVMPRASGVCHLDVDFVSGTRFSTDITVIERSGCCAGFYPDPAGAGQVDVPPPSSDAGAG